MVACRSGPPAAHSVCIEHRHRRQNTFGDTDIGTVDVSSERTLADQGLRNLSFSVRTLPKGSLLMLAPTRRPEHSRAGHE